MAWGDTAIDGVVGTPLICSPKREPFWWNGMPGPVKSLDILLTFYECYVVVEDSKVLSVSVVLYHMEY